jgi:hypothetical protein
MKRTLIILAASIAILSLSACTLSLLGTPTPLPTPILLSTPTPLAATQAPTDSPTPGLPTETPTLSLPTVTPGEAASTAIPGGIVPTAIPGGVLSGSPSGPYGVIRVAAGDVLNVHSSAGTGSSAIGSLAAAASSVMRSGPSTTLNDAVWVQVENPGGGTGWVNAAYLTEYVAPATFCADGRVNALITNFGNAIMTSNGGTLYSLVSPLHGMTVRLWRNGNAVVFDQAHAQWIFTSTFEHDWGAAPGSGLDTIGAIHTVVLPKWLDVFNAPTPGYTLSCNAPQTGGASYDTSWPAIYANVNFYSLYKPGPAGNENSWRTLLIGVDYVQNQPYIYSVTQLEWEP